MIHSYLDIETTGLDSNDSEITVIGIYSVNDTESRLIQLVSPDITKDSLLAALENTGVLYTYNGRRFDLPFIEAKLGIDLEALFHHHDLMYDCWNNNLRGGLKSVEKQLGILHRKSKTCRTVAASSPYRSAAPSKSLPGFAAGDRMSRYSNLTNSGYS